MALKIVGRSKHQPMFFNETPKTIADAKNMTAKCSACGKMCFVTLPFYVTREQRIQVMNKALDEHRRVCTAGDAEQKRVYEIIRPRA